MDTNAVLDALHLALLSVPTSDDDLRATLGDERLVPRLTEDVTAYELLDHIVAVIEREPACFNPNDLIATPDRNSSSVWQQRPEHGVVGDLYGWVILLTRGTLDPSDISAACDRSDGRSGIVDIALSILGFDRDDDEEALDALFGHSWLTDVRERATEAVERIRRFQAAYAERLRAHRIAPDAAASAVARLL